MQRNAAHSIHIRLTFIAVTRYFIGLAEAYNPGLPNWNEYTGCVGSGPPSQSSTGHHFAHHQVLDRGVDGEEENTVVASIRGRLHCPGGGQPREGVGGELGAVSVEHEDCIREAERRGSGG